MKLRFENLALFLVLVFTVFSRISAAPTDLSGYCFDWEWTILQGPSIRGHYITVFRSDGTCYDVLSFVYPIDDRPRKAGTYTYEMVGTEIAELRITYADAEAVTYTLSFNEETSGTGLMGTNVSGSFSFSPVATRWAVANVSTRGLATPSTPMIGGFVVVGDISREVLIRGIGPGLNLFGVEAAASDVEIEVFDGESALMANDDWAVQPAGVQVLSKAMERVGAFPPADKEAALILLLKPGFYTAHVRASQDGEVLFETYVLP